MHTLKRTLGTIVAMLAGLNASNAQQLAKVGYAPFNAPVAFLSGGTAENYRTLDLKSHPAQGALIELLNSIAKDVGLQFEFFPIVAGEQVAELNASKIDLITVSAGGPESKATIVFTAPVYNTSEALVIRKGDTKPYKTFEDLRGEVVGVQRGTVSADGLLKTEIFSAVRQFNSGAELEEAVAKGDIKAGFDSSIFGAIYRLQQNPSVGWTISQSYEPKFINANSFGARRDDEAMIKKIDSSLAKFSADGTTKAIFAKFGVERAVAR